MKKLILLFILICLSPVINADDTFNPLDFTGTTFESNRSVNFKKYSGKLVYIDFWASWCAPCIESMPFMEKLHEQYAEKGFKIIAVNIDEHKSEASTFLEKYPITYLNLYDPKGLIGKEFKVKSMPTAFLVDRNGNILFKHIGFNKEYAVKLEQTIQNQLLILNK